MYDLICLFPSKIADHYSNKPVNTAISLQFAEAKRCVGTSKAKAIRKCDLDLSLLSNIGYVVAVEVFWRIPRIIQVECWWQGVL